MAVVLLRGGGDGGSGFREGDAEMVLRTYLGDLAEGDYTAAAAVLVRGEEPLAARDDLMLLDLDQISVAGVASALPEYCAGGCVRPTSVDVDGQEADGSVRLVAGFGEPRGHPVSRQFVVGEGDDGEAYVRGLPPPDLSPIPG